MVITTTTTITAINRMDKPPGYTYKRTAGVGRLPVDFRPLSPKKMLQLGVFEGKYLNDCRDEFPSSWFTHAKMVGVGESPDISMNRYKVKARQSLQEWQRKGWILAPDNRGWFQWYCRYYMGRRIPGLDDHQIARWKSFKARHVAQLEQHVKKGHRVDRARQALLQWGIETD